MEHDEKCEILNIAEFFRNRGAGFTPEEMTKLKAHESGDFCFCRGRERRFGRGMPMPSDWDGIRNRTFNYILQERQKTLGSAMYKAEKSLDRIIEKKKSGSGARIIQVDFRNRRRLN